MKLHLRAPLLAVLTTAAVVGIVLSAMVVATDDRARAGLTRVATAQSKPAIDEFHPVIREPARHTRGLAADYTVYRPADLGTVPGPLPVLVFGNGACRHHANNSQLATHTQVAAHGFIVVAVGAFDGSEVGDDGMPEPDVLTDGITWAERENARLGSALWQRIDTERIAVAGNS